MPTYVECIKCGASVEGSIELVGPGQKKEAEQSFEVLCDKCEAIEAFNAPMTTRKTKILYESTPK